MKTLVFFILITMSAASFSFAQSGNTVHGKLMAKASTRTYGAHIVSTDTHIWDDSIGSQSRGTEKIYRSEINPDTLDAVSVEQSENSDDISQAVINELKSEAKTDSNYESHKLNAEDLPLVMSSADRKTTSVVIPPFLYFKTQF